MSRKLIPLLFSSLLLFTLMMGCSTKSEPIKSPVTPPNSFSDSGTRVVPDRWWKSFGDTRLNRLVKKSLNKNFELKTAWQRLRQADAVADQESASLFPSLDGFAEGEVSRTDSTDDENLRLGLTAQYEVDLWGRIESNADAADLRAEASLYDYRSAAISLSAEVTRTWFRLIEQYRQLEVLKQQIDTNKKVLSLIKKQFGTGRIRSADVLRQEQLLEATREQKITVESRIQVLEHQLAILLGKSPQKGIHPKTIQLPEIPALPQTGLPIKLIRRRPDIKAAYNRLKAADENLAAAISNQYPRLTLTASVSSNDNDATDLFDDWARSFAGELTAPLIDAGRREARVKESRALKKQRLFEYGQSILTAFQEVEDSLIRELKQEERISNLKRQLELANKTVDRLRTEYLNGSGDYIDVLDALTEEQQIRRDLLEARLIRLEERIALYRSLAGGFDTGRTYATNEQTNIEFQ